MILKFIKSKTYLVFIFSFAIAAMLLAVKGAYLEGEYEQWMAFFMNRSGCFTGIIIGFLSLLFPYLYARLNGQWMEIGRAYVFLIAIIASVTNYWFATLSIWVLGAWAIVDFLCNRRLYLKTVYLLLFAIFLVKIVFCLFSGSAFKTIEQSLSFAILPIIFLLIPMSKLLRRQIYTIAVGILFSVALLTLYRLYEYQSIVQIDFLQILMSAKGYYSAYLCFPVYDHPTYFVIPLLMIFPMVFHLIKTSSSNRLIKWILSWGLLIPVCLSVLYTGSRVGTVIVIACISVYIAYSSNHKPWLQTVICLLFAGAVLFTLSKVSFVDETDFTDVRRSEMLTLSIERIQEHPWLGSGIREQSYPISDVPDLVYNTPHNQFLNELVMLGIVGSIPFFALCLFMVYRSLRPRFNVNIVFWLFFFIPLMWIETPFESAAMVIPFVFWTCMFFADDKPSSRKKPLALFDGVD